MAPNQELSILRRLVTMIEKERAATWREAFSNYELPVEERVDNGTCISGLKLVDRADPELLFAVRENWSRFRPGDPVYLSDGIDILGGIPCEFRGYDSGQRTLDLRLDRFSGARIDDEYFPYQNIVDTRVLDLSRKRLEAVQEMLSSNGYNVARSVVSRNHSPKANRSRRAEAKDLARKLKLDDSQSIGFVDALSHSLALIQGPPGTGKTHLLARIATALAGYGERVLVCCFTHRAINNALNAVVSCNGCSDIFKLSSEHYVDGLSHAVCWTSWANRINTPQQGYIVGATPYGAWKLKDSLPFDVVIFDEAGQLTLDFALMGMSCADRYIFVGDHMQMPPVLVASHSDPLVKKSAFEHLFEKYPSVMLDTTYRMNEGINAFPSEHFYAGRLTPGKHAKKRKLALKDESKFSDVLDPKLPSVFVEINHSGFQMRSPDEAKLIGHLVVELIKKQGVNPGDIAVVAPYRAQVREIKNQIARVSAKERMGIGEELVVDTVERIQGQEREVVIISFASSDEQYLLNQVGFYFMPNRLNVAITRARVKRIMVGSKYAFRVKPSSLDEIRMVNVFKKLFRMTPRVDYTEKVGALK